ncbi:MAG: DUF2723 domain-containing protein [Gemmatimonadetes bacterium]|nr:MAG: DUF2723 domain-containing protein [Gemmatimonadota bacterium]
MAGNVKQYPHWIAVLFVFLFTLAIYTITLAPTTSFWDSGEYIACAYILGIPHPPGNPLYVLIGRLFSMIPYGEEVAWRVNFMSALSTAFSVMLIFLMTFRFTKNWGGSTILEDIPRYVAGISAAFFYAFSFTIWTNAIEAEVYGPLVFFMALICWYVLYWGDQIKNKWHHMHILLIVYLFALAFGIHQTAVLIIPALIIFILISDYRTLLDTKLWFLLLVFATLGYSIHLYLIVRTQVNPGIDEADPYNLYMFGEYIQRKQYRPYRLFERSAPFAIQFRDYIKYHSWQYLNFEQLQYWYPQLKGALLETVKSVYGFLVLFIGLLGGLVHWFTGKEREDRPQSYLSFDDYLVRVFSSRRYFLYGIFLLILWGTPNPNPFNNLLFNSILTNVTGTVPQFIALLALAAIGPAIVFLIIAGGAWVSQFIRPYRHFILLFLLVFITTVGFVFFMNLTDHEVRDRDYFWSPGYMIWAIWMGLGTGGIVYWVSRWFKTASIGKYLVTGLLGMGFIALPLGNMYTQFHSHDRTNEYIAHDYGLNLLESCDPNGIIFTNGDNDTFPLWFIQEVKHIRRDVTVANLSLLNTQWYIKQLRDEWGLAISFTERELSYEDMPGKLYPFRVPQRTPQKIAGMTVNVPGDPNTDVVTVKDLAVYNIIEQNARLATFLNPAEYDAFLQKYPAAKTILPKFEQRFGNPAIEKESIYIDVDRIPESQRQQLGQAYQDLVKLKWRRPIYFAVTVADLMDFDQQGYLSIEGLVFQLDPANKVNRKSMDAVKMEENMWETYKYRGLLAIDGDESPYEDADYRQLLAEGRLSHAVGVYKDENASKLTSNYAAGFSRLASHYRSLADRETDPAKKQEYRNRVLEQFQMATIVTPQFTPLLQGLGIAYEELGEYEKALNAWQEYAQREPDEILPYQGQAQVLVRLGRNEEAIRAIQGYVEAHPTDPQGYAIMAETYKDVGDTLKMIQTYEQGIAQTGEVQLYQNILNNLVQGGQFQLAQEVLDRWQERDPNNNLVRSYRQLIDQELQKTQ